jgi:hypothetical protein
MSAISRRLQLEFILLGYAAVVLFASYSYFQRHLAELQDPQGAMGSSGMWAFGDLMLATFIFCLVMVPTFFLLRFMAQSEPMFAMYSKVALAFSLTAPICGLLLVIVKTRPQAWENLWLARLLIAPYVIFVMLLSRLLGRKTRSKRLVSFALAIEGITFVSLIAAFMVMARAHQ